LSAEAAAATVVVDPDAFSQILINLVDNAVKFSAKAELKVVDVGCRLGPQGRVVVSVRDYGPGVPKDQMRKIFRLFYRVDSGLSRETLGTASARPGAPARRGDGRCRRRRKPRAGAEFSVRLPCRRRSEATGPDLPDRGLGTRGERLGDGVQRAFAESGRDLSAPIFRRGEQLPDLLDDGRAVELPAADRTERDPPCLSTR